MDTKENYDAKELLRELAKIKRALSWSEEKFKAVFEQAPFSIQIFAKNGKVLLYNKASRHLWGLTDDFVENFIMKEYCLFEDPLLIEQGLVEVIKRAFAGEVVEMDPMKYDPTIIGKPGRARWVQPLLYPLRDESGEVREVVLIHNDITDERSAQEERDRLLEELINERNRLEDFISIASHELKTPLTSLTLQTEVIRSIVTSPHTEQDHQALSRFAASSLRQIDRLSRLVDEMLDVGRISSGKLRVDQRQTELADVTSEVLLRFADQLKGLGITVEHSLSPVLVFCDPFRIEQVITNIISNAIRYGQRLPIHVELKQSGDKARLTVKDQGIGIAPEDHEKIFRRFERVGPIDGVSGLGLGLFISKQIVKEHAGSIRVESELGKGSSFIVELPLA